MAPLHTIGNTGTSKGTAKCNYFLEGGYFQASSTFTATKMSLQCYKAGAAGTMNAAIYSSSSPASKLGVCTGVTEAEGELILTLTSGVSIVSGNYYYLCASSANNYVWAGASGGAYYRREDTQWTSWPATSAMVYVGASLLDIYAYDEETAPVANFTGSPVKFTYPVKVSFTDTSTNTPTSWDWNFGDGSAHSTTQNPTHIYQQSGTFTVALKATNGAGNNTKTATAFITSSASLILGNSY